MKNRVGLILGVCGFFVSQISFAEEPVISECKAVDPVVSECKPEDYVQGTMDQVIVATSFRMYSPRCVKVPQGATITIQASERHPLQGMTAIEGVENPFRIEPSGSNSAQTQTLREKGFYGYFCLNHGTPDGLGMAGAILVE